MTLDLRCYMVTGQGTPDDIIARACAAARGGAGVVQVRSKPISARDLLSLTEDIAWAVANVNPHTKVLVDDRVDVALALRSRGVPVHGVHLGQDDLPVTEARRLLGPEAIVGLTTGTHELVRATHEVAGSIDYIGAGPYRPTPTKDSGRPPLGVSGYPPLVEESPVPVVAIGDVTAADAAALCSTGVAGVAVCRELMHSSDSESVARAIVDAFAGGT